MSRRESTIVFGILLFISTFVSLEVYIYVFKRNGFRLPLGLCLMSYQHCEWIVNYRFLVVFLANISSILVFTGKTQFKIARFFLVVLIQCLIPLGLLAHMYFIESSTWFELHGILATISSIVLTYFVTIITTPYTYIYLLMHYLCTRWVRRLAKQEGGQLL